MGSADHVNFLLNGIIIKFKLLWIHCDQGKKRNSDFQMLAFPIGHRDWKPTSKIFERVYLFKRGPVEHILTMANLELKPSPFMPRPIVYSICKCQTFSCNFFSYGLIIEFKSY